MGLDEPAPPAVASARLLLCRMMLLEPRGWGGGESNGFWLDLGKVRSCEPHQEAQWAIVP